ncbi:MAG: ABC transporter substrate-binding protein [Alphaproteobacteria bacterium]|nr:ABC transporter substrate-binding protein [Alphaproteobacteria bacterium]
MMNFKKDSLIKKAAFTLFSFLTWIHITHAETNCEAAKTFMGDMGENVISLLTNQSISDKERADQFRTILETQFNLKAIGKFVLGRYWKQASDEEKQIFLNLFKETTVATYATRFKDYTSEKFEIRGCQVEPDGGVIVSSQIMRPNGQAIPIKWKIFEKKGEMRVYDVILEGISMGITQRSEFSSVIQNGGGSLEALNKALAMKVPQS